MQEINELKHKICYKYVHVVDRRGVVATDFSFSNGGGGFISSASGRVSVVV